MKSHLMLPIFHPEREIYASAIIAMAPAIAKANGPLVGAALLETSRGAEDVGEGVGIGVTVIGGAVTVLCVTTGIVVKTDDPGRVAVISEGIVITSVTGIDVPRVIGTKTVALVVGGSSVLVIV